MNSFIYILSETIDYNKLICDDAGPGYARSMEWASVSLKDLKNVDSKYIYIIDNRVSENETLALSKIFTNNPLAKFIIKIVDPFLENFDHFYYLWAFKMVTLDNVNLLSVYECKELTSFISKVSGKSIIYAPYPYDQAKEISLNNLNKRSNKIIISGSVNGQFYPFRSSIWLKSRRSLSRFLFSILKHPGYAEIHNQDFSHNYVRDNFIKYLSNYKHMLLCGSRCEIELLKFHECAYAGCLPVGKCPSTFPEEIKDLFHKLAIKNLFFSTLKYLLTWNKVDHIKNIEIYRKYLRANRSVSEINKNILSYYKN